MPHPTLEVADIFRRYGDAWRARNAAHLSRGQRRVMTAIELCRTAALGGHVERCDDCAHLRIAYNSCLMGKFGNGESRGRFGMLGGIDTISAPLTLHNIAPLQRGRAPDVDEGEGRPAGLDRKSTRLNSSHRL